MFHISSSTAFPVSASSPIRRSVLSANVLMDKVSSISKGFGFVTYASADEAEKAIAEMDGKTLHGHIITVELAKPQTQYKGGMLIARGPPEPPTEQQ